MLFDVIRCGWGVLEEGSFGKVKIIYEQKYSGEGFPKDFGSGSLPTKYHTWKGSFYLI
jgi:hypothetical protein